MAHFQRLREYDFVEHQNCIFRVLGDIHPPEGYVVSIRYYLDPERNKYTKVKKYGTILQDPDCLRLYGEMLEEIPWYGMKTGICRPRKDDRIFLPDYFFSRLDYYRDSTKIMKSALCFGNYLQDTVGIPKDCIGIGGSFLLGFHTKSSDIDFLVYGSDNCRKMICHLDNRDELAYYCCKLTGWSRSLMARSFHTRIDSSSYPCERTLENRLHFSVLDQHGIKIDIHYVRSKCSTDNILPPKVLTRSEISEYKATVADIEDSHFFPGVIGITDVEDLSGNVRYKDSYLLFMDKRFHFLKQEDAITFRGQFLRILPQKGFLGNADKYIIGNELITCKLGDGY